MKMGKGGNKRVDMSNEKKGEKEEEGTKRG